MIQHDKRHNISEGGAWRQESKARDLMRIPFVASLAATICVGWQSPPSHSTNGLVKLDAKHLPNAIRIHDKVISGGQPDGEKAFRELATLGVKTVVSVDGAKPDVAVAKKHSLRYVHLPHGYDGIPEVRAMELAKAVRDLPGPIYIHCHHGKHRSPAASAVACVSAGLIERSAAEAILKTAGTSLEYRGLYASTRNARRIDDRLLDLLNVEFPETAKLPQMAEAMVALERTHDHVKAIAAADWTSPKSHPDLAPAHEALLLREHFTELLRSESVAKEPAPFREMLLKSEAAAKELEAALAHRTPTGRLRAKAALTVIHKNCTACHKQFRDVPLGEKRAILKAPDSG
jgi:protein tyrosine phosphatase (PTP) superfamily phosphohydrolase (DUF442 family)